MANNLFAPISKEEKQAIQKPAQVDIFAPVQPGEIEDVRNMEGLGVKEDLGLEHLGELGRAGLRGITGGLSEPIVSAIQAPILTGGTAYLEAREKGADFVTALSEGLGAATDPEELMEAIAFDRERTKQLREETPGATLAEIGASMSPASVPSKIMGATGKLMTGGKLLGGPGIIGKSLREGITGGVTGIGSQAAQEIGEGAQALMAGEDVSPVESIERVLDVGETGVAIGAGLPLGIAAIKGAAKVPKKLLSAFSGVDEKVMDKYIANAERIRRAPKKEQIIDEVEKVVQNLEDDLNKGILKKEQAKEAYKHINDSVKESIGEKSRDLTLKLRDAKERLGIATEREIQKLSKTASLEEVGTHVDDALQTLKDKVIEGSARSRELLTSAGERGVQISKKLIQKRINNEINKLKIGGAEFGKGRKSAISNLRNLMDDIALIGGEDAANIDANDVKTIIQTLDEDINFALNAGEFSDALNGATSKIRRSIDQELKKIVPGYSEIMEEVAESAGTLNLASKHFGKKDRQLSALKGAIRPEKKEQARILDELGRLTGNDFKKSIKTARAARGKITTREGRKQIMAGLPESAEINQLQGQLSRAKRPSVRQKVLEKATAPQRKKLLEASNELEKVKSQFNTIKTLGKDPGAKVEAYLSSTKGKNKTLFENLSKLSDYEFTSFMDDIAVRERFTKDATRGSKNVNLWTFLMSGAGATIGATFGGPVGIVLGSVMGSMVDKYGPQMTRKILDQVVKIKGVPTIQKIRKLRLPENVKKYLKDQLVIQTTQSKSREQRKKMRPLGTIGRQ